MKLLAVEPRQYLQYYHSRYHQVQDLGVEVYVLNGEGTPDFWPADRYRLAGSKNIDEMIAVAKDWHGTQRFDGVITFSEGAVIAVAAIAEALGLPGIGVEAALNSRNKYLMRRSHERAGAPIPKWRLVPDLAAAQATAAEFGYPVIIKPTLGAGSHLVFKVHDDAEMRTRFGQAEEGLANLFWVNSEADGVDLGPVGILVESFLDGREFLMEALAWDDEVYLGSFVDRITLEGDTFDDDIHHAPTNLSPADIDAVQAVVRAGAHAQGLRRSAMHAEVRFHDGRPHLLEIAARVGGGGLDMIARLTADYDPIAAVADIGRGVRPRVRHFTPTGVHTASMCLISGAGVVARVNVPTEVSESDRVFLLKITARPGDLIRRPPEGNTIIGFLGTTGESEQDAVDLMNAYADQITVDFE
jgi:biotin carboxylase